MKKILTIENALIRHRQRILFENLNFEIKEGEHWAVVGESGSGKTSFLQTLAGMHVVEGGEFTPWFYDDFKKQHAVPNAYFTYHDLISLVEMKHDFRNLSHIQNFYYQQRYNASDSDDAPTVEDFLLEKIRKNDSSVWTIRKLVEMFELAPLLEKQLIKLSNGESKRLRLAAALAKNPKLLIVDNPLAGLDVNTRQNFHRLFEEISQTGVTLIMVVSPFEIPSVITHVAVLAPNHTIMTFERGDFRPREESTHQVVNPDIDLLKKLLVQKKEKYRALVEMKNVQIRYGQKVIIENINWQILPGERWALSGPNGSGKTTLLSLINGDNPQAYANDITLFDQKRGTGESIWDIKAKIGFMSPELFQYFPTDYNCLQVIESGFYDTLGLFKPGDPKKRETARRWLEMMHLVGFSDTLLGDLSAGQQRLCLLARALVKNPYLLILDEPCQGLDVHQQSFFRGIIDKICEMSELSLIYVTHYREEIPKSITHTLEIS